MKKTKAMPWIFIQEWGPKIKGLSKPKLEEGVSGFIRGQIEMEVEQRMYFLKEQFLCNPDK